MAPGSGGSGAHVRVSRHVPPLVASSFGVSTGHTDRLGQWRLTDTGRRDQDLCAQKGPSMGQIELGKPLAIEETPIPGFLRIDLTVHGDNRGWFKENWQREKMLALGLPDFGPVQNNISFNNEVGVTRGIHAEPWDKFVSVATGRVFGAWVDLREGPSFGAVYTCEIDPSVAVFVPRGVGNAYQTLEPNTAYTYLVNDHWSADARYTFLNLADETVNVPWPIALSEAILSDKDKAHPRLAEVTPFPAPGAEA